MAAEAALGLKFGDELTTWFQIVEGSTLIGTAELFPFNNVIGLDAAVAQTLLSRDIWGGKEARNDSDDLTVAGTPTWTFRPEYVFVGIDGMGGGLFVDLRPGPRHGCVRWWDKVDADACRLEPLASGLTDLLERIAVALDGGAPVDGGTPVASDEGYLTWELAPPGV